MSGDSSNWAPGIYSASARTTDFVTGRGLTCSAEINVAGKCSNQLWKFPIEKSSFLKESELAVDWYPCSRLSLVSTLYIRVWNVDSIGVFLEESWEFAGAGWKLCADDSSSLILDGWGDKPPIFSLIYIFPWRMTRTTVYSTLLPSYFTTSDAILQGKEKLNYMLPFPFEAVRWNCISSGVYAPFNEGSLPFQIFLPFRNLEQFIRRFSRSRVTKWSYGMEFGPKLLFLCMRLELICDKVCTFKPMIYVYLARPWKLILQDSYCVSSWEVWKS